jgi:ribosomal protein L11 methyltransferase
MGHRNTLRLYWEAAPGLELPEGEDLVEENWTPYWRESLGVVRIGPHLALVPAWEEKLPDVPFVFRVDPGMAFGAGDHPTTRSCLRILEALAGAASLASPILDVGAGTGVLALGAASLGAAAVDALDIDPFCFAACRRNAALNGLEGRIRPLLLSLDLLEGTYPLVLANLVAGQLDALAPHLLARVAPGGALLLSGFQPADEGRVRGLFAPSATVEVREEEEGWVALLARRTDAELFPPEPVAVPTAPEECS